MWYSLSLGTERTQQGKLFQDTIGSKERMDRLLKIAIFHVCDPKPLTAISVPDLAGIGTVNTSSHFHKMDCRDTSTCYGDVPLFHASAL